MTARCYHCLFCLLASLLMHLTMAIAQPSLTIHDIDSSSFPHMRARFLLLDADGRMISGLAAEDFRATENGITRPILRLECPAPSVPVRLSSVLTIDCSSSMIKNGHDEIARKAAAAWIDALPLGYSECAVTSFNKYSEINQEFTADRRSLLNAIDNLQFRFGTNYDTAFLSPGGGGIPVASRGRFKRIVVLLSDGRGEGEEEAIVREALRNDVTIYCLALTYECSPILKRIAERTGGMWFEKIASADEAVAIYLKILRSEQRGEPCTVEWLSEPGCDIVRTFALAVPSIPAADSLYIQIPGSGIIMLNAPSARVRLGGAAGNFTQELTLTAGGHPVRIASIAITDPRFTITSGGAPPELLLQPWSSHRVSIRYDPTDSSYVTAELRIEIPPCDPIVLPVSGGEPGPPRLRLHAPNGGERLPVGDTFMIHWSGVLPSTVVRLDYSTDAGGTWLSVEEKGMGPGYLWQIPATPAEQCLMRVAVVEEMKIVAPKWTIPLPAPAVRAVAFSPDGRSVAASGPAQKSIGIWNVATGERLAAHPDRSDRLLWLGYSPDGARLLLVDAARAPRLIDPRTGADLLELKFRDFQSWGGGAYAAHGGEAAIISNSVAALWNVRNGTLTGWFEHSYPLASVAWGAADSRVITGDINGMVEIWDVPGRSSIRSFPAHPGGVNVVAYSPDGRRILSAGEDGMVNLYDSSGVLQHTIRGHSGPVYCASFSPDGLLLLTSGDDAAVKIWDARTGRLVRELLGHAAPVHAAVWSADGRMIATGSDDGNLRVWELGAIGALEDRSDGLWAIVPYEGSVLELDMGTVEVGSYRDSAVVAYLCNNGELPLQVDDILLQGDGAADFTLVQGLPPYTIPSGECVAVTFRFRPRDVGVSLATVAVITRHDTLRGALRGLGIDPRLEILLPVVDFGEVMLGQSRDSLVRGVVRNRGKRDVVITGARLGGPDAASFAILDGGAGGTLAPGESRSVLLRFAPLRFGLAEGELLFDTEGESASGRALLLGRGICAPGGAHRVLLGEVAAPLAPGSIIEIPVLMRDATKLPPQGGRFTMRLRLNPRLLFPLDSDAVMLFLGGDTVIAYEGEWDGSRDTLRTLSFMAALGDAESTPVRLVSFDWDWPCAVDVHRAEEDIVRILVCGEGGSLRLFLDDYDLYLKSPYPNPASGSARIEVFVSLDGPLRLYLTDMAGRAIGVVFHGELAAGTHTLPLDLRGIPSGRYLIVAETPAVRRSGGMEIVR